MSHQSNVDLSRSRLSNAHRFPKNEAIKQFLNAAQSSNNTSFLQNLKIMLYPAFLIGGALASIHYAMNPVGNARRMIVENRMNPIMLRVRHALPFVFLALIYKYSDERFYFSDLRNEKERIKSLDDLYKKSPQLFRTVQQ